MRIGFDAKRLFNNFTGLGNYSRHVVQILAEHFPEHAYHLYTPGVRAHPELAFLEKHPLQIHTPPVGFRNGLLKAYWRSSLVGRDLQRDGIGVFHGLSNELPWGLAGKRIKTVVTIHDLLFLRFPELYPAVDRLIYNRKFKHACRAADRIVAVSGQTARDITAFYRVDPARISVVYQSCSDLFKRPVSAEDIGRVRRKYNLPEAFILNVGTIEKRKNALLILKAMARLKSTLDPYLVVVGRPTGYKRELVAFAAQHQLSNRVLFLHDVPHPELPAFYQAARLFVYPSIFEGFGIPILEALYSGTPVISSTNGCFTEAGGADSLYTNPADDEQLAVLIEKVLTHTQLSQQMIARGRDYATRFDNEKIAGDLMAVYRQL
jgi:glycosyltransferase involved in cell wall biosynthesis